MPALKPKDAGQLERHLVRVHGVVLAVDAADPDVDDGAARQRTGLARLVGPPSPRPESDRAESRRRLDLVDELDATRRVGRGSSVR